MAIEKKQRERIIFDADADVRKALDRIAQYRGIAKRSKALRECVRSIDLIQRTAIGTDNELVIRNRRTGSERVCPVPTLLRNV